MQAYEDITNVKLNGGCVCSGGMSNYQRNNTELFPYAPKMNGGG